MMAVDPGVVGVDVPLFPVRLRIGSDPVLITEFCLFYDINTIS